MTEHTLTLTESGSWQREVQITDGSIDEGNPQSMKTEMLVEAECSCGAIFTDLENAYGHLKEA